VVRTEAQRLSRRRIYILPTRNGLLLGLLLLAMLIGAMNYSNGLAYALTFLLASVAIISILHTYRNLAGLTLLAGNCRPVFAGERARFPIAIDNPGAARFALVLAPTGGEPAISDVEAHTVHWVELMLPTDRRGWCELPRVSIATGFPLGLFRAWSYVDLRQRCLVYPRPELAGPPPMVGEGGADGARRGRGSDDFASVREYRAGDSLRRVHWKALAREQGLLTKEFEGGGSRELWLDWDQTGGLPVEGRLARLCRWVLWAEGQGLDYGLGLPGRRIPVGRGQPQCQRCLEALALHRGAP
jgi:uncharacterized protein (DUF58 family)